ncbi:MAG: hypothetical protein AAF603_01720, partial [Pseudomonadota bacterium]
MFRRLAGATLGAAAVSGGSALGAEDRPFEVLAATLDGRPTVAIVDHHGTAIAVELAPRASQIVQGLAAGAILSDLRDATEVIDFKDLSDPEFAISSGHLGQTEIIMNGEVKVGRVSRG